MYFKSLLVFFVITILLNGCNKLAILSPEGKETFVIKEGTNSMTRDNPFYDEYGSAKTPPYL